MVEKQREEKRKQALNLETMMQKDQENEIVLQRLQKENKKKLLTCMAEEEKEKEEALAIVQKEKEKERTELSRRMGDAEKQSDQVINDIMAAGARSGLIVMVSDNS